MTYDDETILYVGVLGVLTAVFFWLMWYVIMHPSPCSNPKIACHTETTVGITGYMSTPSADGKSVTMTPVYGPIDYQVPDKVKK